MSHFCWICLHACGITKCEALKWLFSFIAVIFGLLAAESENFIDRGHAERLIRDWEHGYCPQEVITLFTEVSLHFISYLSVMRELIPNT